MKNFLTSGYKTVHVCMHCEICTTAKPMNISIIFHSNHLPLPLSIPPSLHFCLHFVYDRGTYYQISFVEISFSSICFLCSTTALKY